MTEAIVLILVAGVCFGVGVAYGQSKGRSEAFREVARELRYSAILRERLQGHKTAVVSSMEAMAERFELRR